MNFLLASIDVTITDKFYGIKYIYGISIVLNISNYPSTHRDLNLDKEKMSGNFHGNKLFVGQNYSSDKNLFWSVHYFF